MMDSDKKKRLLWQIFPLFLIVITLSLTIVAYYSTNYFRNFLLETFEKDLSIRTKLLQRSFDDMLRLKQQDQALSIDKYCKDIGKKTDTRITVILPSGKVVGDSYSKIDAMKNHKNRPEIKEALKREKGVAIRYSSTLEKNMMYTALPVIQENAVTAVVRTSISVSVIDEKIRSVRNNIFAGLLLSIAAAAIAGLYVTKKITEPVEKMRDGALMFAKGNLKTRLAAPDTRELSQLAVTMNQMAKNLDEKIEAFKNRSMELEAVHASMLNGVIAIDESEKIITINNAAAKTFALPARRFKGRYIFEAVRNIEFQEFIKNALAAHKPVEDDIVIKQNRELILNIHSTVLYDTRKKRMGTLIIFHDITRIKKLEKMHKDFASNVSHELQTPLTTIKGFIETLQEMTDSYKHKEQGEFLKIVEKNVNRMIDLINDLLSLSRLERKEGTNTCFEKLKVKPLIQSVVSTYHKKIEAKKIIINIKCPGDLMALLDPILMEQAIANLLDNAVKYSETAGQIDITAFKKEESIEIVVKDQGRGISREHQTKIFNRFYRIDRARSRKEGGTGLGLAIVKHIIQYHNGSVSVHSQKNRGSAFIINIPA